MIRAVIFDLDDTLVKTHVVKWKQHKAVAKEIYGREVTEEKLREHWGKPFDELITALHDGADTIENLRAAYASSADQFPKEIQDDSMELMQTLRSRGIELGIVTATNKDHVFRDLQRLQVPIEQFFSIQAADDTQFHKPDPRVFDSILERLAQLGIAKGETMYVGDALFDLQAARDAGLHFVAVTSGLHTAEAFEKEGASNIITRLAELPDLLMSKTW